MPSTTPRPKTHEARRRRKLFRRRRMAANRAGTWLIERRRPPGIGEGGLRYTPALINLCTASPPATPIEGPHGLRSGARSAPTGVT